MTKSLQTPTGDPLTANEQECGRADLRTDGALCRAKRLSIVLREGRSPDSKKIVRLQQSCKSETIILNNTFDALSSDDKEKAVRLILALKL